MTRAINREKLGWIGLAVGAILLFSVVARATGHTYNESYGPGDNCWVYGHEHEDHITLGDGKDCVALQATGDFGAGEAGDDNLLGGDGPDNLRGSSGGDYIEANDGADYIESDDGADDVYGGKNDDMMKGNDQPDYLYGWDQSINDSLRGGDGNDDCYIDRYYTYNDEYDSCGGDEGNLFSRRINPND